MGKETGLVTKRDVVHYELRSIKNAKILAMLQTYEAAALALLFIIAIYIIKEEARSTSASTSASTSSNLFKIIPGLREFEIKIEETRDRKVREAEERYLPASYEQEKLIRDLGLDPKYTRFAKGIEKRKEMEKKEKEKLV